MALLTLQCYNFTPLLSSFISVQGGGIFNKLGWTRITGNVSKFRLAVFSAKLLQIPHFEKYLQNISCLCPFVPKNPLFCHSGFICLRGFQSSDNYFVLLRHRLTEFLFVFNNHQAIVLAFYTYIRLCLRLSGCKYIGQVLSSVFVYRHQ